VGHAWRRLIEQKRHPDEPSVDGGDVISAVYRDIWLSAAAQVGAEAHDVAGGLEIRKNGAALRLRRKAIGLNDEAAVARADNKGQVHDLLRDARLRTPEYREFELPDLGKALDFLLRAPDACVVKPARGEGGYGVTCGVRTAGQLMRAAVRAARLGPRILVENQVRGDFYRFLVLDDDVLSVVRRHPPTITGDGKSTIEGLIFAENRARAAARIALPGIRIDLDCIATLETAGLSLRTVLPDGVVIAVKSVISQNAPRDNEIVEEAISDELQAEVVQAARVLNLRLAGVDVVATTLTESLSASGGAILEVNGAPGLTYHYEVAEESRVDPVAVPILREMLAEESPRRQSDEARRSRREATK
jgi:D-alanine-D-alanine ligase-like ATP-grasp enzyme